MKIFTFNRTPLECGETSLSKVTQKEVEATPSLRRASLDQAVLFGGPLIRSLLEIAPITGSREYTHVDTRVSYLMPGWYPSIPGWHTDGVPRGASKSPFEKAPPDLSLQEHEESPLFHSITVGLDSPVVFEVSHNLHVGLENHNTANLYKELTTKMQNYIAQGYANLLYPHDQWVSWDWWQIHRAQPASQTGWRLLVRITESDTPPNNTNFIRSQNQVYVPETFGW